MENQKLENVLSLSLAVTEDERERSPSLSAGYEEETKTWELIVKYHGDLSRYGSETVRVEELIAGYAIVTLPENMIEAFSELEEVEYIEKPRRLYFETAQGKRASCITGVTIRQPYLTGRGVLIGIIDSGIDYTSAEFQNRDGTRIRYLWDQTRKSGSEEEKPPAGFAKGVEYSQEQINEALQSRNPQEVVPSFDRSGHGTAVTAIAAAGGNLYDGVLAGVAPESELLIVKLGNTGTESFPRTTELMRGLTYLVMKAIELQMPVAINVSFGNTYGSHDGTSLLERFLDNVAEIGRCCICVGSGNEGAAGGHREGRIAEGEIQRTEWNVGAYQASLSVQLWKEYSNPYEIILVSPSGERRQLDDRKEGAENFLLDGSRILAYVGGPSPYSVNQEIYLELIPEEESYVKSGVWALEVRALGGNPGTYDLYLPSSTVLGAATRFFSSSPEKTLTIPSTAYKVITVGAYDAAFESYADFSGRGYFFSDQQGQIAGGAGSVKPDLAAPGVNIQTLGPDGEVRIVTGTSFAAPFVTGSAALLMEWGIVQGNDPFLYGEKVKAYLRKGARRLRSYGQYPHSRTGYGALCVEESLPGK